MFLAFSCPKLRFWNYFFQIAWNTKKLFDSKLLCSELDFQIAWNTKKLFRFQVALLLLGSSTVSGFFMFKNLDFGTTFFFRLLGTQKSFSIQSCFALSWK